MGLVVDSSAILWDVNATRAVLLTPEGSTRLARTELDPLRDGDLRVRLRLAGICGTDLHKFSTLRPERELVLGHEVVAEITESRCSLFAPGERIVVPHHVACRKCSLCETGSETQCETFQINRLDPGGFAEDFLVRSPAPALAARKVPADIGDETAVWLEPAACVIRSLWRGGVHGTSSNAMRALILGAGSMGLLHLLTLRAFEAKADKADKADRNRIKAVVCEPHQARRRRALEFGASQTVSSLAEATGHFDVVFDTSGKAEALRDSVFLLRAGGTLVLFAHMIPGPVPEEVLQTVFRREQRILSSYSGSLAEQDAAWELIRAGFLDAAPLITHQFPLADYETALEKARAMDALKVALLP